MTVWTDHTDMYETKSLTDNFNTSRKNYIIS